MSDPLSSGMAKKEGSGFLAAFASCSRCDEIDPEQAEDQSHQPADKCFTKRAGPNDHSYSNQ
jgi:hypothetical protein